MKRWLSVPGYPMLEVHYQQSAGKLELSQERLVIGESGHKESGTWDVPLAASIKLDEALLKYKKAEF